MSLCAVYSVSVVTSRPLPVNRHARSHVSNSGSMSQITSHNPLLRSGSVSEPAALTGGLQVPCSIIRQRATSVWDVFAELTSPSTTASSGREPAASTGGVLVPTASTSRVQVPAASTGGVLVPAASTGGNQAASPTTSQSTTSMWDMITELTSPFTASHNTAAHLPSPVSTNKSAVCDLMAFIVLHL